MTKKPPIFYFFLLLLIFICSTYIFGLGGSSNRLLTNILYLIPPFIAVLTGLGATLNYGLSTDRGRTLLLLTVGILSLFVGEVVWFYLRFALNVDPYPSVADGFYILGYPLLFFGLINELRLHQLNLKTMSKFTKTLLVVLITLISLTVLYFGVIQAYMAEASFLENFFAISYGLGDLILIIPCLFILKTTLDYGQGRLFIPWMFIFHGFVFTLVGDILFAIYYQQYQDLTWPYTLIDIAWIVSYFSFAYGFYGIIDAIMKIQEKIKLTHLRTHEKVS